MFHYYASVVLLLKFSIEFLDIFSQNNFTTPAWDCQWKSTAGRKKPFSGACRKVPGFSPADENSPLHFPRPAV
jgi:hypothetical protein